MGVHESVTSTPIGKKWSYTQSFHYDLSPVEKLLKYSNFIFAFAIVLLGISLAVIAVYIDEESQSFILFIGNENLTGLKLLIGAGGVLVLLGGLGLLTTIRLNRKLMLFYVSVTFVSIIVQGAGIGVAVQQITDISEEVNGTFYEMVKNYADYNFEVNSTIPMDYMQKTIKCCGLYAGPSDWNKTAGLATEWIKLHTDDAPDSCCLTAKIKTRCGFNKAIQLTDPEDLKDPTVYQEGCIPKFKTWRAGKISSVTVIVLANFVCQLTSATFLFLLRQSMQTITF